MSAKVSGGTVSETCKCGATVTVTAKDYWYLKEVLAKFHAQHVYCLALVTDVPTSPPSGVSIDQLTALVNWVVRMPNIREQDEMYLLGHADARDEVGKILGMR